MNTTENNKLIAEFMQFKNCNKTIRNEMGKYYDYQLPENFSLILEQEIQIEGENGYGLVEQSYVFDSNLIFHSDWNWLMFVVEKIEGLNIIDSFTIDKEYIDIIAVPEYEKRTMIGKRGFNTKIESVYNACLEFIRWYNEVKQK